MTGPVFAYFPYVKTETHFMRPFLLAFKGDYTQGKQVAFEYFVTGDGRFTPDAYYRFTNDVLMSSDLLKPFAEVKLKPKK